MIEECSNTDAILKFNNELTELIYKYNSEDESEDKMIPVQIVDQMLKKSVQLLSFCLVNKSDIGPVMEELVQAHLTESKQ